MIEHHTHKIQNVIQMELFKAKKSMGARFQENTRGL